MIDVDVSFPNISANKYDNNNSPLGQNFGQTLGEFQPNFSTQVIIGKSYNFGQIFKLVKHNFDPIYGLESVYCGLL